MTVAYMKRALESGELGPCERRALELSQAVILAATGICRTCGFTHSETDCPRWPASAA